LILLNLEQKFWVSNSVRHVGRGAIIRNGLCRWKSSAVDIAENLVATEIRDHLGFPGQVIATV
jgi:hypothetical protein